MASLDFKDCKVHLVIFKDRKVFKVEMDLLGLGFKVSKGCKETLVQVVQVLKVFKDCKAQIVMCKDLLGLKALQDLKVFKGYKALIVMCKDLKDRAVLAILDHRVFKDQHYKEPLEKMEYKVFREFKGLNCKDRREQADSLVLKVLKEF